ncbi:MAG: hypothetical protein IKW48_00330 [Akkermansia sp.]|nr:hypothetical protein [Akkermansia sp.]
MSICRTALFSFITTGLAMSQEPAPTSQSQEGIRLPQLLDTLHLPDEDENGDTLLIALARVASSLPASSRGQLLEPLLEEMLREGHDPLHENKSGCNAVFYLAAMPDFYNKLQANNLLPRELALRIPHEEGPLLRYMRLRNSQALLSKSPGSHDYLVRRYCTPAFERAQRLVQNYLAAPALSAIPTGALSDCLTFMHLASPQAAEGFINSLTLWEHGEHFLEEIPAHLLITLHSMGWNVNPELLRKALHKLGTMLPISKDDMIECAASAPMSRILEMLTNSEGQGAMPELQQYAEAFDPEIVHTALVLQMKLQGLPIPWDAAFLSLTHPEAVQIRETLRVDATIRYGHMDKLTAQQITDAVAVLRQHNMPLHADMLEGIVARDAIILRPELRPAFRTRYEELREAAPHVALLRYLMEHQNLLITGEAAQ